MIESQTSSYALVKINRPEHDPKKLLESIVSEEVKQSIMSSHIDSDLHSLNKRAQKVKYSAKLIAESQKDVMLVEGGSSFTKSWTFLNNGDVSWPLDTRFKFYNGAIIGEDQVKVEKEVNPGEQFEVTVKFEAPKHPAKYSAFYRLVHAKNSRFGKKVWCEIEVPKPQEI